MTEIREREISLALAFHVELSRTFGTEEWQRLDRRLASQERQALNAMLEADYGSAQELGRAQGFMRAIRLLRNLPMLTENDIVALKEELGRLRDSASGVHDPSIWGADPDYQDLLE